MAFKLIIFSFIVAACISLVTCISNDSKHTSQRRRIISKNHILKTIWVKDGDTIDCIDIYKQPAFNHPALKNHTIQEGQIYPSEGADFITSAQMKPTRLPKTETSKDSSNKIASQVWHQYGSCPDGTVPIRRMPNKPEANGTSTDQFQHINHHSKQENESNVIVMPNHSFSVGLTEGFSYSGAKGDMKVWNPYVEDGDYSSSQVMIRTGALRSFETVQAGWAVNPTLYKDSKTRLFGYWTVDGMKSTGCFDLTCPGFVQTSQNIALGADIGSSYGSFITIQIHKDPYKNNWWFIYNNKEVGYWPGEIFSGLKYHGTLVQWGGEVSSKNVGTSPHTGTAMGSGEFSDPVLVTSGAITQLRIEENSNPLKKPEYLYGSSDEWNCYDAYLVKENVQEPWIYYGGPGSRNNPRC